MDLYNWTDGELVTAEKLNAYGEGMEQLKTDTVSAKTAAQEAKEGAENAKTAAQTANTSAQGAKTAAETAKQGAESAETAAAGSASEAAASKTATESAKTAAESAKTAAQAAKTAAETAQTKAEAANTSAQGAKTAAQAAAQSAETAKQSAQSSADSAASNAQRAEDAVAHNPTIQNGIWYVWNPDSGSYVSTGVPATGQMTVEVTYQQGDSPAVPPTGAWLTSPPEVAQGKFLWTKILFSDNTTGYSVARQGVDGTGAVVSVNGKSGEVTLTTDDVNEGTRKYMTAAEKTKLGNVPNDTNAALNGKVDKVTGKQLSTEDYTNADKGKVNNLPENTAAALNGKISKVTPAAAGNLPTLTADGQLTDSGKKADEINSLFIITLTMNNETGTITADKTYNEMKTAYEAGKELVCKATVGEGASIAELTLIRNLTYGYNFCFTYAAGDKTGSNVVFINYVRDADNPNGKWELDTDFLVPVSFGQSGKFLGVGSAGLPEWQSLYTLLTGTLSAGSTTLTLQNAAITLNSVYDIYTDKWGVNPTDVVVTAGKITMTFEKQNASIGVRVEVR